MRSTKIVVLSMLAVFSLILFSCNNDPAPEGEGDAAEQVSDEVNKNREAAWEAALENYHNVMSASFHSAEEDNLEPLKERYQQFAALSRTWVKLPIPAKYQKENIEEALKELEKESAALAQVVEQGSDEEMKKAIYDLHDVFHKVQELCDDH